MSFNKIGRISASSANGPTHGSTNGSRLRHDQNEPRTNCISTGSKSSVYPQSRVSLAGGLKFRGTNANHSSHHGPASTSHLVPSQKGGSGFLVRPGTPEENFLDLALEESDEGSNETSDDEWEEVACAVNGAMVDQPLVAGPSTITLPSRGKRSESLALEVVEDWRPSSPQSTSYASDRHVCQGLVDERDRDLEADLQLEVELTQGLGDLKSPVPGPSRLEVVEQPSPARTSAKGKGKMVERGTVERPRKTGKRAVPSQVSAVEDPQTRKPTVSFKAKATELARSTGRLLAPSKPLPPRNPTAISPSLSAGGPRSAPNIPPHPPSQAASTPHSPRPASRLFTPKGFSNHIQNLREKQTEDTLHRFHERYGGIIVEHARRDLTDLMLSMQSPETPKGTRPTQKRQRTAGGRRVSKAQAQAEEVKEICRSAKSYIVDMAAIKRREVPTIPEPQRPTPGITSSSAWPSFTGSGKTIPVIASREAPKRQPAVPPPVSQNQSTSLGGVPRGLKFARKQEPGLEPGELTRETVGRVTSSERDGHKPRFASASRDPNGLVVKDVSKRRREDLGRNLKGSSPRKKPRLGPS